MLLPRVEAEDGYRKHMAKAYHPHPPPGEPRWLENVNPVQWRYATIEVGTLIAVGHRTFWSFLEIDLDLDGEKTPAVTDLDSRLPRGGQSSGMD